MEQREVRLAPGMVARLRIAGSPALDDLELGAVERLPLLVDLG
jgi:hypothetical protein